MTADDDTRCPVCWSWHDSPVCESPAERQVRINRELAEAIARRMTAERRNDP